MQAKHVVALLAVFSLVLTGCATGLPEPASSATPANSIAIPSTTTVATSTAPGWTSYVSINDILDLAFSPDGTLWAATGGGLIGWDLATETYTRYLIEATEIAPAHDGTLWLASEHGLCHFDAGVCKINPDDQSAIDGAVRSVAVAPGGVVWAGTETDVGRFDGRSWKRCPSPAPVQDLAVAADGEVWAATANGVGRYVPSEEVWTFYTEEHGLPSSHAQVVAVSPEGDVWTYVLYEGLFRFDGANWRPVDGAPGGRVADIAFAPDGNLWVAFAGGLHFPAGSLAHYDGHMWTDVTTDQGLASISAVGLGPEGLVAAGTSLGLGIYQGGEWHFLKEGPTHDAVTSVVVTPDGAAWFGFGDHSASTPGGGLSRFDGHDWHYFLDNSEVNALAVSPDGSLWVGAGCDVQRFDGVAWENVALCGEYLMTGNISDIVFTPDGSAWVANGFGLARFDGERTVYDRMIGSVVVAPDGAIWMNGWEGRQDSFYVARFDWLEWTTYKGGDSFPGGFMVGAMTPDGRLWGTVPERRLASFDGQSWADELSWTFYDTADGLPLDSILVMAVAPDGALWVGTEGGVARFDGQNWSAYPTEHGLVGNAVRAIAFGRDAEVWFGATRFRPAEADAAPASTAISEDAGAATTDTTSAETPQPTATPADMGQPTTTSTAAPQPTSVPTSAPSGKAQIVTFSGNPSPADPSGMLTLNWTVRGAHSVTVSWVDKNMENAGHRQLPLSGSLSVALSSVKFSGGDHVQFWVSAQDANDQVILDENGQAVAKRLSVPLMTDLRIDTFTVTPDPVERGGMVTLTWNAPGAESVGITPVSPDGIFLTTVAHDLAASGSFEIQVPEEFVTSITYHLWALDANGVARDAYATVGIICPYEEYFASRCPQSRDYIQAAYEPFERGYMVWRSDTREIYVLYGDGFYQTYEDTWHEGDPVDIEGTPPQGLFAPVRGFGNLWANQQEVRDALGWPTAAESGYTMLLETVRGGSGRYGGIGVYFTLPDDRVVNLYPFSSSWEFVP